MFDHDPRNDSRTGREIIPWSAAGAGSSAQRAAAASTARARRVLVACGVAVAAGVTGVMALIYPSADVPPDPVPGGFVFPDLPEPSAAVSMLPAPSTGSTPSPVTPTTTQVATAVPTTKWPKPTTTSRTPAPPAALRFTVGSTVGLELNGRPGYRLRHLNYTGRVDLIDSAQDRADAKFVVRKGLGRTDCVSLEAVNYPGYFLRHQYYVLRLQPAGRRENPELFAADTTFCPVPTGDGTAYLLKSINYPDRALALHSDGVLHLDTGGSTSFRVRKPL